MRGCVGEGVDLDRGLLLCIEDEGLVYSELRARLRFPSML